MRERETMDGMRKLVVWWMMVVIMATTLGTESRKPVLHRVGGGRNTWAPNTNFSIWASHEQFYVGDWLYFGFNKSAYNVLEVNKASYNKCIDTNFITNITRGGRDVFNLTEAKTYYFLSGRGYCFRGMKVAVFVQENLSPNPSPFLLTNSANVSHYRVYVLLVTLLAFALHFNLVFHFILIY